MQRNAAEVAQSRKILIVTGMRFNLGTQPRTSISSQVDALRAFHDCEHLLLIEKR